MEALPHSAWATNTPISMPSFSMVLAMASWTSRGRPGHTVVFKSPETPVVEIADFVFGRHAFACFAHLAEVRGEFALERGILPSRLGEGCGGGCCRSADGGDGGLGEISSVHNMYNAFLDWFGCLKSEYLSSCPAMQFFFDAARGFSAELSGNPREFSCIGVESADIGFL